MSETAVPGVQLKLGASDTELQAALSHVLTTAKTYATGLTTALNNTNPAETLEQKLDGLSDTVEHELHETQGIIKGFAEKAMHALHVLEFTHIAHFALDLGKEFIKLGSVAEDNFTKMSAIIRATGGAAGYTAEQLAVMAEEISSKTNFDDDALVAAQSALLTFRNIKGDQFKEVLELSTDLAEVMGTDLTSAAEGLARAFEDPGEAMLSLRKAGVILTDEQVKEIKELKEAGKVREAQALLIEHVGSRIKGVAEEMATTGSGGWKRVQKDVEDIYKVFGKALLPVIEELLPYLRDLADYVLALTEPVEQSTEAFSGWGDTVIGYLKEAWEWAQDFTYTILAGFNTLTLEWGSLVEFIGYGAAYLATRLMNQLAYVFTEVLPTVIKWFFQRFKESLLNAADFLRATFFNMTTNIKEFVAGVQRYLKTGKADFKFVALLDGFKATWEELPAMAERGEDELEEKLKRRMNAAGSRVASTFFDQFQQIKEGSSRIVRDALNKEEPDMKPGEGTPYEHDKGKDDKDKTDKGKKGDAESLEDLAKRISSEAAKNYDKDSLDEQKKQTALLEQLVEDNMDPVLQQDELDGTGLDSSTGVDTVATIDQMLSGLEAGIMQDFEGMRSVIDGAEPRTRSLDALSSTSPENPSDPFNDMGYLPSEYAMNMWAERGVNLDPSIPIPQNPQQLANADLNRLDDAHLKELQAMNAWLQANGKEQVEAFRDGVGKAQ